MARVTVFGDFKVDGVKFLNLSGELVYLLNTSDVNMVNFEAPIHTSSKPVRKSGPNISQHVEAPGWLEERGFNAVSLANNHTLDFGEGGLDATISAFGKSKVMGVGTYDEAYKLHVFQCEDGIRVGVICCTHHEFGCLSDRYDKAKGCATSLSPEIAKIISEGVNQADVLIVYNHGGIEYMDVPLPEWREVYRQWIDLGADAVIASHPHVPQGIEYYHGKPIAYSLGNFCFDSLKKEAPQHWYESLCCVLDIDKPHDVKMTVRPLVYDQAKGYICDNESIDFQKYLQHISDLLNDEESYLKVVNEKVKCLGKYYRHLFSRSGYVCNPFNKEFLKGFVEGFMGKGFWNNTYMMNNIRCESHRWAFLRAMNLKQ